MPGNDKRTRRLAVKQSRNGCFTCKYASMEHSRGLHSYLSSLGNAKSNATRPGRVVGDAHWGTANVKAILVKPLRRTLELSCKPKTVHGLTFHCHRSVQAIHYRATDWPRWAVTYCVAYAREAQLSLLHFGAPSYLNLRTATLRYTLQLPLLGLRSSTHVDVGPMDAQN